MKESEVRRAVRTVLGDRMYDARIRAEFYLPQLLDDAAKRCFMDTDYSQNAQVIRDALEMLQSPGFFECEEE